MIKTFSVDFGALVPVQVQFGRLDAFGALLHTESLTLVDSAAATHWEARGYYDFGEPTSPDAYTMIRETTVTYDAPIRPQFRLMMPHVAVPEFSPLAVHLWIEQIQATSYTLGFRIVSSQGTEQYAHGSHVQVKVDPATLRPAPWSEAALRDLRELLHCPKRDSQT